jgi:hypothetical protein
MTGEPLRPPVSRFAAAATNVTGLHAAVFEALKRVRLPNLACRA